MFKISAFGNDVFSNNIGNVRGNRPLSSSGQGGIYCCCCADCCCCG